MQLRDLLPSPRSAEDILARRVRLDIGGEEYVLPVLPIRDNRAWTDRLHGEVSTVFRDVEEGGEDVTTVLAALAAAPDRFMDMLLLYDIGHVLPAREAIEAVWTEVDLLIACLEVWRAAHPLVDIGLGIVATTETRARDSLPHTSSPSESGAGTSPIERIN